MQQSTEAKSIIPAAAKVGDISILQMKNTDHVDTACALRMGSELWYSLPVFCC